MNKLRGGLYGCGMISEFHLRAWQRIPEVDIVALGNRTRERAEERRAQFFPAALVYQDLRTMLREAELDFVDILTPPARHFEHCMTAAEAGVHIICQKPLCDDLDDARALVTALGGRQKLFAVHENHRYRPWFRRLRQLHAESFFGQLRFVRLEHLNATAPAEAYKLTSALGQGRVMNWESFMKRRDFMKSAVVITGAQLARGERPQQSANGDRVENWAKQHPRLYFNQQAIARLRQRVKTPVRDDGFKPLLTCWR